MRRDRWNGRTGLALAAAVILFLQGLFGAYANAAFIAAEPVDAFGNPLCLSMPVEDGASGKHDPATMPGCCTLACQISASLLPPEPSGKLSPALGAWISIDAHLPRPLELARHAGHAPGNPRAPPQAV